MGILQFFKDLFGPRQPCELCRLGREQWEARRSGTADWQIHGHGLEAELFICEPCGGLLMRTGANQKNPTLVLGQLVRAGYAHRPDTRTMLQHGAWKTIWRHMLKNGGFTTGSSEETVIVVDSVLEEILQTELRERASGEIRDEALYALYETAKAEAIKPST